MNSNVVFLGWNRAIAGKDQSSVQLFGEFTQYLGGLQKAGTIRSFEAVLLDPHGGDLNGFFRIQGESSQLDALTASEAWEGYLFRASLHLEGLGVVRGVTGDAAAAQLSRWQKLIAG
jgi:hypothetical protein